MSQAKKDTWTVAGFTMAITGSLLMILLPVEYFNQGPPGEFSKSVFFLLGFGLLSSLLAFKFPSAGRSLLRGYYIFFVLSCLVLSVEAIRDSVSVVAAGLSIGPLLLCWTIARSLRKEKREPESTL